MKVTNLKLHYIGDKASAISIEYIENHTMHRVNFSIELGHAPDFKAMSLALAEFIYGADS